MAKPFHLVLAAGLGAVAVASLAWAGPTSESAKTEDRAVTVLARADLDDAPRPSEERARFEAPLPLGPHGRYAGPGFGPHRIGPPLAVRLAEQETVIGIRSNQLDAWRDYADALQAMLAPPKRPAASGASEAFAFQQAMAEDIAARGRAAEKLKSAIDALKPKLSAEQLERAALVFGPKGFCPDGFGPRHIGGPVAPPQAPRAPSSGPGGMERGAAQPG